MLYTCVNASLVKREMTVARQERINALEVVQRELSRLKVQRMALSDFQIQAQMSDEEKAAFQALLKRKNEVVYVDATNGGNIRVMVGTFEGGE